MSKENPVHIIGHKNKIYRVGKSHNPHAGPWRFECECGEAKVALGQGMIARYKDRHLKAVVFGALPT